MPAVRGKPIIVPTASSGRLIRAKSELFRGSLFKIQLQVVLPSYFVSLGRQVLSFNRGLFGARFLNFLRKYLDPHSKKLLRNSTWVLFANSVYVGSVFIQSVILSRFLGVALFGTYILILVIIETTREFLNPNVDVAMVKFASSYRSHDEHYKVAAFLKGSHLAAFTATFLTILTVTIMLLLPFHIFGPHPELTVLILGTAAAKSLSLFDNISMGLLRVYDRFRLNSIIRIGLALFELAIMTGIVVLFPKQLPAIFGGIITVSVMGFIIRNGAAAWECRQVFALYRSTRLGAIGENWKEIKHFVLSNSGSRTIKTLITSGDILLLGFLSNTQQVGIYAVAKKLANSVLVLTDPMFVSIYPQLASLTSAHRHEEVLRMLKKISSLLLLPVLLFLLLALLWNRPIINLVYGAAYTNAGAPFAILIMAVCVQAFLFWLTPLLLSSGKVVFKLIIDVISLLIGGVLAMILIPVYGAVGAAVAMLVLVVVSHAVFLYVTMK